MGVFNLHSERINAIFFQKQTLETVTLRFVEETHLILVGLLLVADWQVRGVDIQVDVVVTSDAPAALLSCRYPLELHMGVMALLPLLPRRGQAVDPPIHIHRP